MELIEIDEKVMDMRLAGREDGWTLDTSDGWTDLIREQVMERG